MAKKNCRPTNSPQNPTAPIPKPVAPATPQAPGTNPPAQQPEKKTVPQ